MSFEGSKSLKYGLNVRAPPGRKVLPVRPPPLFAEDDDDNGNVGGPLSGDVARANAELQRRQLQARARDTEKARNLSGAPGMRADGGPGAGGVCGGASAGRVGV